MSFPMRHYLHTNERFSAKCSLPLNWCLNATEIEGRANNINDYTRGELTNAPLHALSCRQGYTHLDFHPASWR